MKDCYGIYGIWIDNELVYYALIRVLKSKFNKEGKSRGFRF